MKTGWIKTAAIVMLALFVAGLGLGCGKDREETEKEKQTKDNIANLEQEMKGLEAHQATLGKMIKDMQTQLEAMQAELDSQTPKLKSTNDSIAYLKDLTNQGFGPGPFDYVLRNPNFSFPVVLTLISLLFIVLILYRYHRSQADKNS
jgi:hypothetical protein